MARPSKSVKYYGTYTSNKGKTQIEAYVLWNWDKEGFAIYNASTFRMIVPTVYATFSDVIENTTFVRGTREEKVEVVTA